MTGSTPGRPNGAAIFLIFVLLGAGASADVVTDWNEIMQNTVVAADPVVRSRSAAITQVAVFEAVNSIVGVYEPYVRRIHAPPQSLPEAAVIAAAHRALTSLHPQSATGLDALRADALAGLGDRPGKADGVAVGVQAADAILALRSDDGFGVEVPYTPGIEPGNWQPTPPRFVPAFAAGLGRMAAFGIAAGGQFRMEAPPALRSKAYARDYNEVRQVGEAGNSARSPDRQDLARFYALTQADGIYYPVARQVAAVRNRSLAQNARIFALLSMAIWDGAVACFESKYHFNLWRPVTAIRAADTDRNHRTESDASWDSLVETPPFPSYPSAHASVGGAARAVLEYAFGKGGHSIRLTNPLLPQVVLNYTRFEQITDDIDEARIDGGVHFRFDQRAGAQQGRRVGKYLVRHRLRPTHKNAHESRANVLAADEVLWGSEVLEASEILWLQDGTAMDLGQ